MTASLTTTTTATATTKDESAKFAASFGDWNLMVKGGEYFFQHQDPTYAPGKLTMLEPGIVDGRAKAIFNENPIEDFSTLILDDEQMNDLIEDNYEVKKVVSRANAWISQNAQPIEIGEEVKPQDPHSTREELQEEHTMKKTTKAAVLSVKMNDQFQINAAVNYWNSQKSWVQILNELDFVYKAEAREWGVKLVVHSKGDEEDTYGVVFLGEPSNKMTNLSESMMIKLNTSESSVDKEKFFAEQIFFGDYEKMLKKEIIPFYERHLRDLAAEESITDN